MNTFAPTAVQALANLRDPHHFNWSIVSLFAIVFYLYCVEIGKGNWNLVISALGCAALEWIGEIVNALILHFSGYAALWMEPGASAYLILVGINIETLFMFLLFGLAVVKLLPANRKLKWWGVNNRVWVVSGLALFCVAVEVVLNAWGALAWEYRFWGWPHVWSIFLMAYVPAAASAVWLHDMKSMRAKVKIFLGALAFDIAAMALFVGYLGWI